MFVPFNPNLYNHHFPFANYLLLIAADQVREKSQRSVAMSRPTRSSLSASTPDSLSDNESVHGRYTQRKPSVPTRTGLTPGGSLGNSKPNSRPLSRQGSKPPSRQGSTLSLDSTGGWKMSEVEKKRGEY